MSQKVGIEQIGVYWPACCVRTQDLAPVRGEDGAKIQFGLGIDSFAVPAPFEDGVTMAANAALHLFKHWKGSKGDIGRVVVGTESAMDSAKPMAAYLHELLDLPPNCEAFDVKFACVAGTYALLDALRFARSTGRKALVVTTDISIYGPTAGSAEFTQGAGAVAMLVSTRPDLMVINPDETGTHTKDEPDFYRPFGRLEAVVNGKYSVDCYLRSLAAVDDYCKLTGANLFSSGDPKGGVKTMIFHVPYPGLPKKALDRILATHCVDDEKRASLHENLKAALKAGSRLGNAYTASLFFCLTGVLVSQGLSAVGRRIGLYSYGSGSGSKFLVAQLGEGVREATHLAEAYAGLDHLVPLSVPDYERYFFAKELPWEDLPFQYEGVAIESIDDTGYRRYGYRGNDENTKKVT